MRSSALRGLALVAGGGIGLAAALTQPACTSDVFACAASDDCQDGGSPGTCEPSGFCSFPDPECLSGSRYGDHAGDGLAGDCVPAEGTGSESVGDDATQVGSLEDTAAATTDADTTGNVTTITTTVTTTMPGDGSTTDVPLPSCGDGVLDPGEGCDDMNDAVGDGCNDCELGGEILWSLVEDGGANLRDGMLGVALGSGDEIFVGGFFTTELTPEIAARQMALDGTVVWTTIVPGDPAWTSALTWGIDVDEANRPAVAADASGDWVVVQFEDDGEIAWQASEPGEAYGLSIGASVWVCGLTANGVGRILSYGDTGTVTNRLEGTGHPVDGFGWDIVVDDGTLVVAGTLDTATPRGYLWRVDPGGNLLAELDFGTEHHNALAVAVGAPTIWIGGHSDPLLTGWVARTDAMLQLLDGPIDVTGPRMDGNIHGITIGPAGEVVAVGWTDVDGFAEGLVQKFSADAELIWQRTYDVHAGEPDQLRDVVVASDGTIVVAGHAGGLNPMGDAWVMRVTP